MGANAVTSGERHKVRASAHPLQTANANDNYPVKLLTTKELLQMSLNFRPLSENIPSWKKDAYSSNNPSLATITYNISDNVWELRDKFGELVEQHRDKEELVIELNIWKECWDNRRNTDRQNRKGAA